MLTCCPAQRLSCLEHLELAVVGPASADTPSVTGLRTVLHSSGDAAASGRPRPCCQLSQDIPGAPLVPASCAQCTAWRRAGGWPLDAGVHGASGAIEYFEWVQGNIWCIMHHTNGRIGEARRWVHQIGEHPLPVAVRERGEEHISHRGQAQSSPRSWQWLSRRAGMPRRPRKSGGG